MIDSCLQKTVPFINMEELIENNQKYTILDTRALNEYQVSHLKNAIHVGYSEFNISNLSAKISHEKPIVVYCSIGYRSEKIGEKLLKKGYTVYNLYGGIFNWKNNNHDVIDNDKRVTNKIHCYNKKWSKWLLKGEKIYE